MMQDVAAADVDVQPEIVTRRVWHQRSYSHRHE